MLLGDVRAKVETGHAALSGSRNASEALADVVAAGNLYGFLDDKDRRVGVEKHNVGSIIGEDASNCWPVLSYRDRFLLRAPKVGMECTEPIRFVWFVVEDREARHTQVTPRSH